MCYQIKNVPLYNDMGRYYYPTIEIIYHIGSIEEDCITADQKKYLNIKKRRDRAREQRDSLKSLHDFIMWGDNF